MQMLDYIVLVHNVDSVHAIMLTAPGCYQIQGDILLADKYDFNSKFKG